MFAPSYAWKLVCLSFQNSHRNHNIRRALQAYGRAPGSMLARICVLVLRAHPTQPHRCLVARQESLRNFLGRNLGPPPPFIFGPFLVVELDNDVSLDFYKQGDFDQAFARIRERGLQHWADPCRNGPSEIIQNDGGREVYFEDPDSHFLELITQPYGSGAYRQ